jgi:hypothetical protein
MDTKKSITIFVLISLLVGVAMVSSRQSIAQASDLAEADGITVPFSWTLTDSQGRASKTGVYAFTFALYDAKEGGNLLWSEQQSDVKVSGGKVNVELGAVTPIPASLLEEKDAQYWLAVSVRGSDERSFTDLSPRQPILLSPQSTDALACPHSHFTDYWSGTSSAYGLDVHNSGTGDGIRSNSNSTNNNYAAIWAINGSTGTAVYGSSSGGNGGYFTSNTNDGVNATTNATGMSGVYGHATNSFGVTGASTNSFGVQARGGGDSSLTDSVGDLYLDGTIGEIFANGSSGMALESNYDIRAMLDRDNNNTNEWFSVYNGAGTVIFHVDPSGNIFATGSKAGYVVDVAQNDDTVSMETGDVVVISGAGKPIVGEIPLIEVQLASTEGTGAVLGVVDTCYVTPSEHETGTSNNTNGVSCADASSFAPGDYITVVTLGSFKAIKVDASFGAIQPGDLLVASSNPGYAMVSHDPKVGTVIGKALEGLASGTGTIAVLITYQ